MPTKVRSCGGGVRHEQGTACHWYEERGSGEDKPNAMFIFSSICCFHGRRAAVAPSDIEAVGPVLVFSVGDQRREKESLQRQSQAQRHDNGCRDRHERLVRLEQLGVFRLLQR